MKEISALALRASCRVEISWPGGGFWDLIRSLYWLLASSTRFCDGDLKIPVLYKLFIFVNLVDKMRQMFFS